MFKEAGEEVVAYDNLTKYELKRTSYDIEQARNYNLNFLKEKNVTFVKANIRDILALNEYAKDVDYIVNCAAQPAMTISLEDPVYDFKVNCEGLLNLLEVCRKRDIPLAHCSTIHVYGNDFNSYLRATPNGFKYFMESIPEDYALLGGLITPLHASKRAGEVYCLSYWHTYGLDVGIFRLTGIYGERQFGSEDHGWVANFAIKIISGVPITIYGNDLQVRDILYVKDAAKVFDCFIKHPISGIYNIGGGKLCSISLRRCIEKLSKIIGKDPKIRYVDARKGDLWWFVCDVSKASRELNWRPSTIPDLGLPLLVNWIKENKKIFGGVA